MRASDPIADGRFGEREDKAIETIAHFGRRRVQEMRVNPATGTRDFLLLTARRDMRVTP